MRILDQEVDKSGIIKSEYRIIIGEKYIRYIFVDPEVFSAEILTSPDALLDHLPPLPAGEWKQVRISRKPKGEGGEVYLEPTSGGTAEVETVWHPRRVDVLSIQDKFENDLSTLVKTVTLGDGVRAVAKIARFDFEIPRIEQETKVYKTIEGKEIGPAFLGHITEEGRVMGFLIEYVEGEKAGRKHLEACRSLLKRLHGFGIAHRDCNRYNFLAATDGRVRLIDFETAVFDGDAEEMTKEYEQLKAQLTETTGRGGEAADWNPEDTAEKE